MQSVAIVMKIYMTMYSHCLPASQSVKRLIIYLSKQRIKNLMQEIFVDKINQEINVFYKLWFDKANSWMPHGRLQIGSFL